LKREGLPDKLTGINGHNLHFVIVGIVPPEERYLAVLNLENAVIADGYSVCIPTEVLKDLFYAIKRRLAINDPLFVVELLMKLSNV
jgi:hypothetical protein